MLVVETVTPEGIAAQAGVQPRDRLLHYAVQPLMSPFHLQALEENTFSDQPLPLELEREGQTQNMTVPTGKLGISVRPELPEDILALYEHARQEQQAGLLNEAVQQLAQAAQQATISGNKDVSVYLSVEAGALYEKLGDCERALAMYEQGRQADVFREDPASLVQLQVGSGRCFEKLQDFVKSALYYEKASELAEKRGYEIWQARYCHQLGNLAWQRGDLSLAYDYHLHALAIRERLDPGSLNVASSLGNLGNVAADRGDLFLAQDLYLRTLTIFEKIAPDSLHVARTLGNLGGIAWRRGDLALAQDYFSHALAIQERLDPGSMDVARSLINLGNIVRERDELSLAQDFYSRALAIQENLAPGSLDMAYSLNNLGIIAKARGDLTLAQDYYLRCLAISEKMAPDSLDVAICLHNLGIVACDREDLSLAKHYHFRALAIRENLAPGSLDLAEGLEQIGKMFLKQQKPQQALSYLQRALDLVEKQRSAIQATEARALLLAKHAVKFFTLVQAYLALNLQLDAFSVLERLHARSLSELLAERHFSFNVSKDLIQQQQDLDQQQAQTYSALAQLSLADQDQVEKMHAKLRSLERQQQELTFRIRQTSPGYAALHYPQPLEAKVAQSALEIGTLLLSFLIGEEKSYLFSVTRKALSCYELPIGQKALEEKVHAFRNALDVYSLENTLTEAIELGHELYALLLSPAQVAIDKASRLLICADGPLHLLPVAALVIKTGKKLVYLGQKKPLHTTFSMTVYTQTRQAALSRQELPGKAAKIARERTSQTLEKLGQAAVGVWQQGWKVLALGDPVYATGRRKLVLSGARSARKQQADNSELAGLRSRGLSLDPLPHTREEVEAIAGLFGEQAVVKIGEEATKAAAIKESEQADIVHFACHGWLDPKMPLSSGLILSQPQGLGKNASKEDNGLLQAWEIFKLRLKAELVVLSACQTGLGAEIRGEGLIGLTRAFTYAGAKSVLVSLWEINDKSTAEFMQAFYQSFKAGKSKDKALQQAIKKMSRKGKWQHPFFWSAFSLVGDWQ